jgi:hypothetical protein
MSESDWAAIRPNLRAVFEAADWWEILHGHVARAAAEEDRGFLRHAAEAAGEIDWSDAPWPQLVARLKETFAFCEQAFAKLDDSKLNTPIQLFGPNPFSMASAMFITVGDWADHYSQEANYLRLNGILPPTAQPRRGM